MAALAGEVGSGQRGSMFGRCWVQLGDSRRVESLRCGRVDGAKDLRL